MGDEKKNKQTNQQTLTTIIKAIGKNLPVTRRNRKPEMPLVNMAVLNPDPQGLQMQQELFFFTTVAAPSTEVCHTQCDLLQVIDSTAYDAHLLYM